MRHGAVAYFDDDGRPVPEDDVPLTAEGREQAEATRELLDGVELDRVIASGLPRTTETAALVAPGHEVEHVARAAGAEGRRSSPRSRRTSSRRRSCTRSAASSRTRSGSSAARPSASSSTASFPRVERLVADDGWDTALVVAHGAVNRAILSYALTGERMFLGRFEQAPGCLNVLDVDGSEPSGSSAPSTSRRAISSTARRA